MAEPLGLGRPATSEEIAAWNWDVSPDGAGLPEGSGDATGGEEVFADKCASCHGDFAEGLGNWPKLAGGTDTLDREDPVKTVGSYWPYATTAFDYIKRSMPFGNAGSLTDDEVYATLAYILYSNDLIDDDFVLSHETLPEVELPNADGFFVDDRAEAEYPQWSGAPCMDNCKDEVKVTMRARVLDVTPQEETTEPVAAEVPVAQTKDASAPTEAAALDPEMVAAGETVFRKCKACHQVGEGAKNKVGPLLTGVVGAPAGAVDGFKYSKAFEAAAADGLIWTDETLSQFLMAPKSYIKGTRMSYAGLKKDEDRLALIAYLKSVDE